MRAWRIEKDIHIPTAKIGEGARLEGARWNPAGMPMVYAAAHLSLAVLEVLVHAHTPAQRRAKRSRVAIEIPDEAVEVLDRARVPRGFSMRTPFGVTQALGEEWLSNRRSVALLVPSLIVPEDCVLLNPLHPAYGRCKWADFVSIELDPRLWSV